MNGGPVRSRRHALRVSTVTPIMGAASAVVTARPVVVSLVFIVGSPFRWWCGGFTVGLGGAGLRCNNFHKPDTG